MTLMIDATVTQATAGCWCGWIAYATSALPVLAHDEVRRKLAEHVGERHPRDVTGDREGMPGGTRMVIEVRTVETVTVT